MLHRLVTGFCQTVLSKHPWHAGTATSPMRHDWVCSPKQSLVPNDRRARTHADTPLYKPSLCQHIPSVSTHQQVHWSCNIYGMLSVQDLIHQHAHTRTHRRGSCLLADKPFPTLHSPHLYSLHHCHSNSMGPLVPAPGWACTHA